MSLPTPTKSIDDLYAEVENLERQLKAATQACDELNIQARFWKQAADHAVDGWNKLEEKYEAAIEAIGELLESGAVDMPLKHWHALETIYNAAIAAEADPDA